VLLLAAATSLPELATTITAVVLLDNPTLAVHNLLGGVALQTGLLIVADAATRHRGSLTFFSPRFVLLIQGLGVVFLLQLTVAGLTARGAPVVFSFSSWMLLVLLGWIGLMYLVYRWKGHPRWTPTRTDDVPKEVLQEGAPISREDESLSRQRIWLGFAAMSVIVLAGGWLATQSAEVIADETGLGYAFLGATFLAAATSMPELSTTIAAVRGDRYTVAISNIFGSNLFDVTLLVLAELLYRGGTILDRTDPSLIFVAMIAALMTCVYLWGLMERDNRTIAGIGWDSALALAIYVGGMTVLYLAPWGSPGSAGTA
jgi:cation:H+ antiporter